MSRSAPASEAVLTVGAVAQRLGVSVSTLRSWDRRYGLGPTQHDPGRHRRYSTADLARLRRMIALTAEGVPPSSAARAALGETVAPSPARDGGGTGSVAVGRADRAVRGLARAAARLDVSAVQELTERHIGERGVAQTWERLLVPLLHNLGERFERGSDVVAIEHAATVGILNALHKTPVAEQHHRLPALLGCAPDEQHGLPLEALAAALAERNCPTRVLGTRVPSDAMCSAAEKLRPMSVVVWAHTARLARQIDLARLQASCTVLLLVGPGWSQVRAAQDYWCPLSLGEAAQAVFDTSHPLTTA